MITWLAEIGDITRFESVNKLLAYAGLDPSDQISAGKVTGTKTRKGNTRLHVALRKAARATLCRARSCKFSMWGGVTWGVTPELVSRRRSTRWHGGSAKRCTIAISRMNPLMTRVIRPCSVSRATRSVRRGDGVKPRCRSEPQRQRPVDVAAGRRRVLQRPGEATGMRKSHHSGGSKLDQQSPEAVPGPNPEGKGPRDVGDSACRGGLRLQGIVTRRSKPR